MRQPIWTKQKARVLARIIIKDWPLIAGTPIIFGLCVYMAVCFTQTSSTVAAIWPANGVLLAALLMARRRAVWIICISCMLANFVGNYCSGAHAALAAAAYSFVNIGEATFAAWLLRKARVHELDFIDTNSVAKFVILTTFATVPGALSGALLVKAAHGADFVSAFTTWFMADVLGLLVVAPAFALILRAPATPEQSHTAKLGLAALFVCVSGLVFSQASAPVLFLVTPVAVAIGFHLGPRCVALTTLFLTATSLVATYLGSGPAMLIEDAALRVWVMQLFCLINHFTTWFVAAAIGERNVLLVRNKRLALEEATARRQLDVALNAMKQGLCLFDANGRVAAHNDRFLELYNLSKHSVGIGTTIDELKSLCTERGISPTSENPSISLSDTDEFDQLLTDGRCINISQQMVSDGGCVCTYTDVSNERAAAEELRHASLHDALTGLRNRRFFDDAMAKAYEGQSPFGLILIDLDHFKSVNDTYGHGTGDELLKIVANRLRASVRDGDEVARLGGDEFAVLARDIEDIISLEQIASRMLDASRLPVKVCETVLSVSLSIGAGFKERGSTSKELINAVDAALYLAKSQGRNRVQLATLSSCLLDASAIPEKLSA